MGLGFFPSLRTSQYFIISGRNLNENCREINFYASKDEKMSKKIHLVYFCCTCNNYVKEEKN